MKIIQIKNIEFEYIEQIEQIEFSSFTRPWNRKDISDAISNSNSFSFILTERNQINGYLFAIKIYEEISINKLCIIEEKRNCGYGNNFIEYFLNEAIKTDVEKIFLEVNIQNTNAIMLYKNNGFQINRIRKYDSTGQNTMYEMIRKM